MERTFITEKHFNYIKGVFTVIMAVYAIVTMRDVMTSRLLDNVDIVCHEAGHLLFGYFGEFIKVCGGTIGQLLVPAAIGVYFVMRGELYSGAVTLFWFGQNMFPISVYIKDAATMELPMISVGGGDEVIHDWNYLLLKFNVLAWDQEIGNFVYWIGAVIVMGSILLAFLFSFEGGEKA